MKTVDLAKGRWAEILVGLGHADALNVKHSPCPVCGGTDRYRYLNDEFGGFFCASTRGDGIGLIKHLRDCSDKEAFELIESVIGKPEFNRGAVKPISYAQTLAQKCIKVPRSAYLEGRGLEMPDNLFFSKDVKYFSNGKAVGVFDAMLAPFTKDGKFITFQATYLHKGKKAPIECPRKTLATDLSLSGGAVQLYPAQEVLGVAEGVETSIACHMLNGIPVWATLSASLMKGFNPPSCVKKLIIFGDNDENYTGHASAYHLANRMRIKGIDVEIKIPEVVGQDWLDVLQNKKGITEENCDTINVPETLNSIVDWSNNYGESND